MKFRRATILVACLLVAAWVVEAMRPTAAMPPFAQAYGMDCQVCHSIVPALNAYGRYVQRTGYASLDPATIHRANPAWVAENPFYDSQDPDFPHQVQWGNLALHAAGYIGTDWTFHLHQWIYQNNVAGGTDTMWVTYNNLFHHDGHLFIGKIEAPAPSPFSQFFDLSAFAPPEVTVGEHPWPLDANRWGTKLAYTHEWLTAEVAYLGPSGDVTGSGGATDWSSSTEKTFQWRLVDALGYKPVEFGLYGGVGTFPTSDGLLDKYNGGAAYAQVDPTRGFPGALVIYQRGHDGHAGAGLGTATHTGFSTEVWEPLFHNQVLISYRNEYTNDGLGNLTHFNYIDAAWLAAHHVSDRNANGLMVNFQATLNQNATPSWQAQIWYVTTIGALRGQ